MAESIKPAKNLSFFIASISPINAPHAIVVFIKRS